MPSTLVVGTDTYITLDDARTYAATYSYTQLPTDDTVADKLLRQATLALDRIYGNRYIGTKQQSNQSLYWPRVFGSENTYEAEFGFVIVDSDGNPIQFDVIPENLGWAEVELALLQQAGVSLYAQPPAAIIKERDKIDVLETESTYGVRGSGTPWSEQPLYNVTLILRPLLKPVGQYQTYRGA